jgi:hypothetical protein
MNNVLLVAAFEPSDQTGYEKSYRAVIKELRLTGSFFVEFPIPADMIAEIPAV